MLCPFCRLWDGFVRGERTERLDHPRNEIQPTIDDRPATVSLVSTLRTKSWPRGSWTCKSKIKKEKRTESLNTRRHHDVRDYPNRRVFILYFLHVFVLANLFWLKKGCSFFQIRTESSSIKYLLLNNLYKYLLLNNLATGWGLSFQSSFVHNYQ